METEHELDMSGVNADGTWFQRCACGWVTGPRSTAADAANEFLDHSDPTHTILL